MKIIHSFNLVAIDYYFHDSFYFHFPTGETVS